MQRPFVVRFLFAAALLLSSAAYSQEGYNEIFDENGQLREIYYPMYPMWKKKYSTRQNKFLEESRKTFQQDNALDSMPRMLTREEFAEIQAGVEQRAKALKLFLQDHHSGKRLYSYSGFLTEEKVLGIIARSGDAGYERKVRPSQIQFFYGPDIIRDSHGKWRILEDNIGYVGGIGDLLLARDIILKSYPELHEYYDINKPENFYDRVAENMRNEAAKYGGRAVFYTMPIHSADNEDKRISKIFEDRGIITVNPFSNPRLLFKENGVFLQYNYSKKLEKVGFIYMNGEHAWMDPKNKVAEIRFAMEQAEGFLDMETTAPSLKKKLKEALNNLDPVTGKPDVELLKQLISEAGSYFWSTRTANRSEGLVDAILSNKVGVNYSPGSDFVGDKEFYLYVEDLIRFYLNEEPILRNVETFKFVNNDGRLNEVLLRRVEENYQDYVVKKFDGRGGDAVWVGRKITKAEMKKALAEVKQSPGMYQAQKFTALSTLNDNIVDLRLHTYVAKNEVILADAPWGRGLPKNGNGKVNLSDKGREVTIIPASLKIKLCRYLFN